MPPGQQTSRTYKKIWLYLTGEIRYQELIIEQSIYVYPWTNLNIHINLYLRVCECGGAYAICVDAYIGQKRVGTRAPKAGDRGDCEPLSVVLRTKLRCHGKEASTLDQWAENLTKLLLKKLRNSGNNNQFLKNINKALKWKNTLSRIKYMRGEINFRIYQAK